MVQKKNPDYVLTIKHVTEYYDMKMVTFGVNDGVELVVAFPVFVQDHTRESMTLYELQHHFKCLENGTKEKSGLCPHNQTCHRVL